MRVAVLICFVFAASAYGKMVYPEDLPKGLVPESKIVELENGLKNGTVSLINLDSIRFSRAACVICQAMLILT